MRNVTESILRLAKKRQGVARRVAQIKGANQIPIENLAVEEKLKLETNEYARKLGLEETFAKQILDVLLEHSKNAQREEIFRRRIASYLQDEGIGSVFVIGSGRMGGWFARYFSTFGVRVSLFDTKKGFAGRRASEIGCDAVNRFDEASNHDLVLLAVPISETPRELGRLRKLLLGKKSQCKAIVEVSSIKGGALRKEGNGSGGKSAVPVISIHPLFGPSAHKFGVNSIVVVEDEKNRGKFGLDFVKNLFPQFNVVLMSRRAHDEQMAICLSLPHVLALAFRDVVSRSKRSSERIGTPSYKAMDDFSKKVLGENPGVYFEIESMNSFTPAMLRDLKLSLDRMTRYFEKGEKDAFKRAFFEGVSKKKN